MSRVLLIPVASPLHDPALVGEVLRIYRQNLENVVDDFLPIILRREDLEKQDVGDNVLGIIAPLTGGTEHIIQFLFERCGFTLLAPHDSMNSLPAAVEIFSKLKNSNRAWIILEWPPGKRIQKFVKAWKTINEIKNMKVGLIGEPSPWLVYSSGIDIEKNIGILFEGLKLLRISISEVYRELEKISESELSTLMGEIKKKAYSINIPENEIAESLRIYLCLKRIVEKYGLDAATIRCFDIIMYRSATSCLAVSLFNSMISVFGCEGDLSALLTMILFSKLADAPSFMGNLSWIEDDILTLAHCTAPISITEKFELNTHFESGKGVGVKCHFTEDSEVTVGRLDPASRIFRYLVGETVRKPINEKACRTQISIRVRGSDIRKLSKIVEEPVGNHYVVVLKDISEELEYTARIMGIKLERI